jgi:uncharacterized protein
MIKKLKSFLGTGWGFPPRFNKFMHTVEMVSDEEDIKESIRIILGTYPGERIMQPKFGCYMRDWSFENIDTELLMKINAEIKRALLNFEPRVIFIDSKVVERDDLNGFLLIEINYKIIITNTRHNIVYPFYIKEGTLLPG